MGIILDGQKISEQICENIKKKVANFDKKPKLAVILVGDDEPSQIYVRIKQKKALSLGFESVDLKYPKDITEEELLKVIENLNNDKSVNAILVQLPLPENLDKNKILNTINPKKDVDGFHFENVGKLATNQNPYAIACTARGILDLLNAYDIDVEGKSVVVVGRSNIVGMPVAKLMQNKNATVTVCHSKTKNLKLHTQNADIVICATGKPKLLTADMIKENAVVVDVGITKINGKLVGDVDFDAIIKKAAYVSPVPKGVGPMTIAGLMQNTLDLYELQAE